jgi:transcriptional regulator with XRE-family HTH domain
MSPSAGSSTPVDPTDTGGDLDRLLIARRLVEARKAAGLSARQLAAQIDVSPSLISQIERGRSTPSVSTLYAIVTALDISMDELFADASGDAAAPKRRDRHVLRRADRATIDLQGGVRWERLTPRSEPAVEFLEVSYEPGGESTDAGHAMQHNGRDYAVIISGELSARIGFEQIVLRPGDSCVFDATIPHRFWNEGTETARAIFVVASRDSVLGEH